MFETLSGLTLDSHERHSCLQLPYGVFAPTHRQGPGAQSSGVTRPRPRSMKVMSWGVTRPTQLQSQALSPIPCCLRWPGGTSRAPLNQALSVRGRFPRSPLWCGLGRLWLPQVGVPTLLGMGRAQPCPMPSLPGLQGGDPYSLLPSAKLSTCLCKVGEVPREVLRDQLSQDACRGSSREGAPKSEASAAGIAEKGVGRSPLQVRPQPGLVPPAEPEPGDRCPSQTVAWGSRLASPG